jgi:hypothetical protein
MTAEERWAERTSVHRFAAFVALLICSLLVVAAAQGGKPRLEQKRLLPADMALAKRTALRASDLRSGWRRTAPTQGSPALPSCAGVDLDFSAFTITGTARSKFERRGAAVESFVEVFESRADAAADFRKATRPRVLACIARWLRREAAKQGNARLVSAGVRSRPRLGDQSIAYRIAIEVFTPADRVHVYVDMVGFQRGRSAVTLLFSRALAPVGGQLDVARLVAARAR